MSFVSDIYYCIYVHTHHDEEENGLARLRSLLLYPHFLERKKNTNLQGYRSGIIVSVVILFLFSILFLYHYNYYYYLLCCLICLYIPPYLQLYILPIYYIVLHTFITICYIILHTYCLIYLFLVFGFHCLDTDYFPNLSN